MAGTERQNSSAESPKALNPSPQPPKKPLQVMHISKREEQDRLRREAEEARAAADAAAAKAEQLEQAAREAGTSLAPPPQAVVPAAPRTADPQASRSPDHDDFGGMTMADLMGGSEPRRKPAQMQQAPGGLQRSVDDFDFDEDAFLAALDENEPIGTTGEVVTGTVIGLSAII